jgi:hypothetical protein
MKSSEMRCNSLTSVGCTSPINFIGIREKPIATSGKIPPVRTLSGIICDQNSRTKNGFSGLDFKGFRVRMGKTSMWGTTTANRKFTFPVQFSETDFVDNKIMIVCYRTGFVLTRTHKLDIDLIPGLIPMLSPALLLHYQSKHLRSPKRGLKIHFRPSFICDCLLVFVQSPDAASRLIFNIPNSAK